MFTGNTIRFYPRHPSDEKTYFIETNPMPFLPQAEPFPVKELCMACAADPESFFATYTDKRFDVTGIAKRVGPDGHNKPSIELAENVEDRPFALVIFPNDDHYAKVTVGDKVVVRANYLVMCNKYGIVMKHSQLVAVEK